MIKAGLYFILLNFAFLFTFTLGLSQPLAFPGAEGFGKYSKGGRGGIVIYVTNLNDSGTGSLREALTSSSYKGKKRTIVFKVSGTIELLSTIEIKYDSCITIAGQTAPGDGICIKNFPFKIGDSRDIIIRYIRFRIGDQQDCGTGCDEIDALSFRKCHNIMLDHCSLGWSIDAVLDLTVQTGYSTVQWCLLHEPLSNSKHSKGGHSYIAGWDGNSYGGGNVFGGGSYHHNLLTCGGSRTPRLDKYAGENGERDLIDIVNNVIYNWSGYGAYGGEAADVNWQNNYHKYGPSTSDKDQIFLPGDTCRMYVSGNFVFGYPAVTADNSKGISPSALLTVKQILQNEPYNVWPIDMQFAEDAYTSVLNHSGAFVPKRDSCDIRLINDVLNRKGRIIDSQSQVGGWPVLNSTAAPVDTDTDGMPDLWEDAKGLDKNNAVDRNNIATNGYTQLEVYLNSIEFQKAVPGVKYQYDQDGNIKVSWNDIYIGEDSFRIERSVNGSDFISIATVNPNTSSYIDGLSFQQSDIINYRAIAIQKDVVESPASELVPATGLMLQINDTVYAGDTIDLGIIFEPENTTNRLYKLEISQPSDTIAELSKTGRLIAKNAGTVTITASLSDGSDIAESKEVVIVNPVSSFDKRSFPGNFVTIFPNPSSNGMFYIKADEIIGTLKIKVSDIAGRMIYEFNVEDQGIFQLPYKFDKGVYLLNITCGNNTIHKIIVNK